MPKTFTWKDLKIFVNTLPKSELNKPVKLWKAETPEIIVDDAYVLSEDWYETDEAYEPKSVVEGDLGEDETIDDYELIATKGSPFLSVE